MGLNKDLDGLLLRRVTPVCLFLQEEVTIMKTHPHTYFAFKVLQNILKCRQTLSCGKPYSDPAVAKTV